MHRIINFAAAMVAASLLGACATVTGGTTQNMTVDSDPQGAICTLTRAGQTIGVVNPSPGTVRIDKSKNAIAVSCRKPGYQDSVESIDSEFTGATFGNILIGGLIGVAIDASTGANNLYPESITLLMTPTSFATAAERDAHFLRMTQRVSDSTKALIAKANTNCTVSKELCDKDIKKFEAARDQQVAALERRRLATPVDGSDAPPQTPAAQPPASVPEARDGNGNPISFASVAERDQWAEGQLQLADRKRKAAVQAAHIKCGALYAETRCAAELAASSTDYNNEVARIEKLRSAIPVRPRV